MRRIARARRNYECFSDDGFSPCSIFCWSALMPRQYATRGRQIRSLLAKQSGGCVAMSAACIQRCPCTYGTMARIGTHRQDIAPVPRKQPSTQSGVVGVVAALNPPPSGAPIARRVLCWRSMGSINRLFAQIRVRLWLTAVSARVRCRATAITSPELLQQPLHVAGVVGAALSLGPDRPSGMQQ